MKPRSFKDLYRIEMAVAFAGKVWAAIGIIALLTFLYLIFK